MMTNKQYRKKERRCKNDYGQTDYEYLGYCGKVIKNNKKGVITMMIIRWPIALN